MTHTSPSHRLPLYQAPRWTASHILLGCAALLLILLAWQWLLPSQKAHWIPPAPQGGSVAQLLPPLPNLDDGNIATRWPQRQDQLLLLQERPLFVMGRKPPPPVVAAPTEDPAQADHWSTAQVQGTFASGHATGAFVLLNGQSERILQGQTLGGWQLTGVQPRAIEIRRGGQKRQLSVQKIDLTQAAPQSAAGSKGAAVPSPFAVTTPTAAAEQAAATLPEQPAQDAAATKADAAKETAPDTKPAKKRPVFGGTSSKTKS